MHDGAESDFAEFYSATWPRTLAVTYAMTGDRGAAEELAQEAYVRAWSQWAKYGHNYLSFPFTIGVVLIFLMWLGGNIPNRTDVVWIREGMGGKAGVGQRILVRAVELEILGQSGEPAERAMHLFGAALEQAAATHRKQRVPDKCDAIAVKDIGDVAERVARDFPDLRLMSPDRSAIAFLQCDIKPRHAPVLSGGTNDDRARRFLDCQIPPGMVRVPVRVEDLADPPAPPLRLGQHRRRIAGIDHRGFAAVGIMDQPQIIVGEGRNRDNLKHRLCSR